MKEAEEQLILIQEQFADLQLRTTAKVHAKKVWKTQGIKALNALPIEYRQAWEEHYQQRRSKEAQNALYNREYRHSHSPEAGSTTDQAELEAQFTQAVVSMGRGINRLRLGDEFALNNNALAYMMGFLKAHPEITELDIPREVGGGSSSQLIGGVDIGAFFSYFKNNTTITALSLGVKEDLIEDSEAQILAEFLENDSQLTHFSISQNINISDSGIEMIVKALEKNVRLNDCYLNTHCGPKGLNMVANMVAQLEEKNNSRQTITELLKEDENIPGAKPPLLHGFHQHLPIQGIRSLIGEYLAVPKLRAPKVVHLR